MNRFVRRVAIAVVSPALVAAALFGASADSRPAPQTGQQHVAAPAKVCFQNPVWGDSPCLL